MSARTKTDDKRDLIISGYIMHFSLVSKLLFSSFYLLFLNRAIPIVPHFSWRYNWLLYNGSVGVESIRQEMTGPLWQKKNTNECVSKLNWQTMEFFRLHWRCYREENRFLFISFLSVQSWWTMNSMAFKKQWKQQQNKETQMLSNHHNTPEGLVGRATANLSFKLQLLLSSHLNFLWPVSHFYFDWLKCAGLKCY